MAVLLLTEVFVLCIFITNIQGYQYNVKTFTVPVDHFDFGNNKTFEMRYLINDTFWNKDGGPIFFYTGNEGDIELFADNTGFMWDIAPKYQAMILFAEHRYYGHSMPFGNLSFSGPQFTGFLSSQQAMADYVDLLTYLRKDQKVKSPVIAFGGSYGGMLAAYIRMKYPHVIAGSISASAPIWQFQNMTPCFIYSRLVTSSFTSANQNCSQNIQRSWKALDETTKTDDGKSWLSKQWKLCSPVTNDTTLRLLKDWLSNVYGNLAMVNYPYPTNFLQNLPANPVDAVCKHLTNDTKGNRELLASLFNGLQVYYNYTGAAKCLDFNVEATSQLGDLGWDYQACTEMVLPMCSDNVNDMFEETPWNIKTYSEECYKRWKVRPQPGLAEKLYGGKNIAAASNIVFSNGLLDPWSGGGVLKNISKTVVSVIIPEGAHHLDLRASNPNDPTSVREARKNHQRFIKTWISLYSQEHHDHQ